MLLPAAGVVTKPCRHCGSPARFNPCWWGIKHKTYDPGSYDPPCMDDMYGEDYRERQRLEWQATKNIGFWICAVLLFLLGLYGFARAEQKPYHSAPHLLDWIPATCCVTNDCCWEISEREVRALPDDEWEIRSTGQVRKRTAYSPDGKFYRCACDYDNAGKHWVRHQGANTRCIFVPPRLF